MRRFLSTIAVNIAVFICLLFAANIAAIGAISALNAVRGGDQTDRRAALPNYGDAQWPQVHFAEFESLGTRYHAFYGWRRLPFLGQTITIDEDGIRRTDAAERSGPGLVRIGVFGGSTMWGTGARDHETIPSALARQDSTWVVVNFGESGYRAHQSLNFLIRRLMEGDRFDIVVFYDGVNEAEACRSELEFYSHVREEQIRSILEHQRSGPGLQSLIEPIAYVTTRIGGSLKARMAAEAHAVHDVDLYDCHVDSIKAERIVELLVADWLIARSVVELFGGQFIAVLQPVAYLSRTRLSHIDIDGQRPGLRTVYETLYPLIRDRAERASQLEGLHFVDLSTALNVDDWIYIDFAHLSPNGNQIIAERIGDELETLFQSKADGNDKTTTANVRGSH